MTAERRIALPDTHHINWPGSTFVEALTSEQDVSVTAWLPPKPSNELDLASAFVLATTPLRQRRYIERKTLAQQTGAGEDDVSALRSYCEDCGLRVEGSHWRSMTLSGPVERLADAFGATVATFIDASGNRFRHRSDALHVPPKVARLLRGVFGLHQWPRSRKLGSLQRHAAPLSALQVEERYAFPDGDGSGQTIGVVQFRGEFKGADFDRCLQSQGITADRPIVKRVDDAAVHHELETTKDLEAALDVQIIAALAPRARIVIYEAPDDERGFLDAIRTAIFDDELRPSIISISYGWPEQLWTPAVLTLLNELFAAASLLGISVFCSSGDHGAEIDDAGKPHVVAPASSPFVHACGGTVVGVDGGAAESAWSGTGGGFSAHFDAPAWQAGVARGGRGMPDFAAQVVPGYTVYLDDIELAIGGTSAIAPLYAALTARINQRLGLSAGLMTPLLYASPDKAFHDLSNGSNGYFSAATGWDPCTGLGVPIGTGIETVLRDGG
ncbi:MAG TPA: S53 family peptidase [Candidatus Baltobacteraceae bacterium]|nr:S53 family peptidase [Candidatus Baltobacteraceae bacterium]